MSHNIFRRSRAKINDLPEVNISEEGSIRSLHLGSPTIQSSMDLDDPCRLVLSYSRAMMGWLLFNKNVKHIVQIGLGGGSFSRWIDCYLPDTKDTVIEINPQVVSVARNFFELPFEGERQNFEIILADGAEYIKVYRESVDVIMVDGFDNIQIIDALVTEDFFLDCKNALSDEGIFVTNWWNNDKRYHTFIERLRQNFDGFVLELPAEASGNVAVMAFKNMPQELNLLKLNETASKLENTYHLDFVSMVKTIKLSNTTSNQNLFFSS